MARTAPSPFLPGVVALGLLFASAPASAAMPGQEALDWLESMSGNPAVQLGARVLLAILMFIGGWIAAKLVAYATFRVFMRTQVDNEIAKRLGVEMLRKESSPADAVERFVAKVVYWLVMLLVLVAVLDFAGLSQVAAPLAGLVDTVVQALPRIGKAGIILVVAYVAGRILRIVVTGALDRFGVDRRFAELTEGDGARASGPFSEAAGRVVFWLLVLVGLAGAFEALQIGPIADPLRSAIDHVIGKVPRIGVAVVLVAVGWFGGRIARALLRNVLQGLGFDRLVARLQVDRLTGNTSASDVVGIAAMVFIVVQASVAALGEVGLETLSLPLTDMMGQIWNLLPPLAVSVVIVVVAAFVGRLLRRVVAGALHNLGLDSFMARLGFQKLSEREDRLGEYSELVAFAVQVGVVLLGVAQALDNLALETWAGYVNAFLGYVVKNVAVATLVVGVGFAIGNYVRDLIKARDGTAWLGEFARYAVLALAFTMAVRQLDVADDFVLLTFGLLFGALCLGAALAFGLGGREVAGAILERRWQAARAEIDRARPSTPPRPTPPAPPKV